MADLSEQVAELRGAVIARLDDGSERMGRIESKVERVADIAEAVGRQLADHERRLHTLEDGRQTDRQDRTAANATVANRVMLGVNLAWSGFLTFLQVRHH